MTTPARRLTLASGVGHDWSCDPAETDPKSRATLWRCSRCGYKDVLILAQYDDPGSVLDGWASLGTSETCDDLTVGAVLES